MSELSEKTEEATAEEATAEEATFEQTLAELEQIVRQLEEGTLGLSESLARYEQGVKRLKECFGHLDRAERRVELLERVDPAGEAVTRPFDDEATIKRHSLSAGANPKSKSPPGAAASKQSKAKRRSARADEADAGGEHSPRNLF